MRWSSVVLLCFLASCESSSIGNDVADAPIGSVVYDARSSFDARVSCERQTECGGTQICNPATMRCVASLACTTHAQCGGEAYCQSGMCAPNVLRGLCDVDENCVGQEHCDNGRCGCGGQLLTATAVAPNMLIALDRSQSMDGIVPNSGNRSRWQVAVSAIKQLTMTYAGEVRFGLALWPGTNTSCTGSGQMSCQGVNQAVGLGGTSGAIGTALDNAGRCNLMTPIGGTLDQLVDFAPLGDATRDNYVVLVTDGDENCGGNGAARATELRMRTPPVRTFAVGFGGDVNSTLLNSIATNGGTARSGTTKYYQADDEATLLAAFQDIAGNIVSCDYTLSTEPDSPDRLYVFFGTTQLARDPTHTTGWDYNPTTKHLTFYGASCDTLRSGSAGNLVVSFGCPILP